jgi:hypothetical protein
MNSSKIIGWLTFLAGIIIIGSTIYFTYNVFTGAAATPQIFNFEFVAQDTSQAEETGLEAGLKRLVTEQLENLIPLDSMSKFADLTAWTVGAWVIISGGGKISELGIRLISVPTHKDQS